MTGTNVSSHDDEARKDKIDDKRKDCGFDFFRSTEHITANDSSLWKLVDLGLASADSPKKKD